MTEAMEKYEELEADRNRLRMNALAAAAEIRNLQKKNDNQRHIIVAAGNEARVSREVIAERQGTIDILRIERDACLDAGDTMLATHETLQAAHDIAMDELIAARESNEDALSVRYATGWTDGLAHGRAQCNHHPEVMTHIEHTKVVNAAYEKAFDEGNEEGYADGLAQGRREHDDDAAYDQGFKNGVKSADEAVRTVHDRGLREGRKEGFEQGRKFAVTDWLQHFILYMQDSGESLAVCKLSQLDEMREASRNIREILDIIDIGDDVGSHLEDIENVLAGLESL